MKFNWGPSCYFSVSVCFLILLNSLKRKTNVVYRSDENTVAMETVNGMTSVGLDSCVSR